MKIIKHGFLSLEKYGFVCEECGAEFLATNDECEFLRVFKNNELVDIVRMCQCPTCKEFVRFDKTKSIRKE